MSVLWGGEMKIKIIKGPLFAEREKQAHELLYKIINKQIKEEKNKEKVS